ncbi:MAG: AAA family ATPase [Planctomycetota bacterium]|jgi:proteasome-associated ATPase
MNEQVNNRESALTAEQMRERIRNRAEMAASASASARPGRRTSRSQALMEENRQLRRCLAEASEAQEQLAAMIETMMAPPHHPVYVIGVQGDQAGRKLLVQHGDFRRLVNVSAELAGDEVNVGNQVLLNNELNVAVRKSPFAFNSGGQVAIFERYLDASRAIIRWRDEETVAVVPDELELEGGDAVQFNPAIALIHAKVERRGQSSMLVAGSPDVSFKDIGGMDDVIEEVKLTLALFTTDRALASKYGIRPAKSIMLTGPPGVGKTMFARALRHHLGEQSPGAQSRFMHIKPAEVTSMWYGESEANIRRLFAEARQVAEDGRPVVMFFDEIESIACTRGRSHVHADDRVVAALLAELDGFDQLENVLVLTSTNRADVIDPALLRPGRLGDRTINIPRPNRDAAIAILGCHLSRDLPFVASAEGGTVDDLREEMIESVVSTIYAPNGDNALGTVKFRDGGTQVVRAGDLVSGAMLANVARVAIEKALHREIRGESKGLHLVDLLESLEVEFDRAASVLTPRNCHDHLSLPSDRDVVSIARAERAAPQIHRVLNVA